jgi:hypothetical protein
VKDESTDTITIRVPKALKGKLEKKTKENKITLNLLINQILTKNLNWDEYMTTMGWLQFNPFTVKEIFKALDEKKMIEITKSIAFEIIDAIKFIYGDVSLNSVIDFLDTWHNSANIPFRRIENGASHQYIVNHKLGKKWSIFETKTIEQFLGELGFKVIISQMRTESCSFRVLK